MAGAVAVAKPAGAGSALMGIVDYVPRHHYRGDRAAYYGGPAAFAGAGLLCSTGLRSAPVVYDPPVILYDLPVVAYPVSVRALCRRRAAAGARLLRHLFEQVRAKWLSCLAHRACG